LTDRRLAARLRSLAVRICRKYESPPPAWTASPPGSAQSCPRGHTQSGQGLVEYGVILVIMAVACVVSLVFFGDQLSSLLSLIASAV
jgi:Flp pilus assembly pilin Flp